VAGSASESHSAQRAAAQLGAAAATSQASGGLRELLAFVMSRAEMFNVLAARIRALEASVDRLRSDSVIFEETFHHTVDIQLEERLSHGVLRGGGDASRTEQLSRPGWAGADAAAGSAAGCGAPPCKFVELDDSLVFTLTEDDFDTAPSSGSKEVLEEACAPPSALGHPAPAVLMTDTLRTAPYTDVGTMTDIAVALDVSLIPTYGWLHTMQAILTQAGNALAREVRERAAEIQALLSDGDAREPVGSMVDVLGDWSAPAPLDDDDLRDIYSSCGNLRLAAEGIVVALSHAPTPQCMGVSDLECLFAQACLCAAPCPAALPSDFLPSPRHAFSEDDLALVRQQLRMVRDALAGSLGDVMGGVPPARSAGIGDLVDVPLSVGSGMTSYALGVGGASASAGGDFRSLPAAPWVAVYGRFAAARHAALKGRLIGRLSSTRWKDMEDDGAPDILPASYLDGAGAAPASSSGSGEKVDRGVCSESDPGSGWETQWREFIPKVVNSESLNALNDIVLVLEGCPGSTGLPGELGPFKHLVDEFPSVLELRSLDGAGRFALHLLIPHQDLKLHVVSDNILGGADSALRLVRIAIKRAYRQDPRNMELIGGLKALRDRLHS